MKLFFDEDVGRKVAEGFAARVPDVEVDFVGPGRSIEKGTADVDWIAYAAEHGFLALSHNRKMLRVEAERRVLIEAGLGIVFIPSEMRVQEKIELLVRRRTWLERVDRRSRPFALYISRAGRVVEYGVRL